MTTPVRFATPRITPGAGLRLLKLMTAGALLASASVTQAVCLNTSAGSGQGIVKGSAIMAPLMAGITTSTTALPDETFNWVAPAPLSFVSAAGQSVSETLPWVVNGATMSVESLQAVYIPPTTPTGTANVTVSTTSCPTGVMTYTINIADLLNPTTTILGGDNQAVLPGAASDPLVLGLTHTDPGGGPTVLSATLVPVFFTVSSVSIASLHPSMQLATLKVYSDGGGIAPVQFFVDPAAPVGSSFTITASAPGYPTQVFSATVAAPTPTMTIVSGNGQSVAAGSTSAPLKVETLLSGVPDSIPVTFSVVDGDATIAESGGSTYVSALAGNQQEASIVHGNIIGSIRVTANAPGYPGVQFILNTVPRGAIVVTSGEGQSLAPNTQSAPIVIETQGSLGLDVGNTVTFSVASGDATIVESGSGSYVSSDTFETGTHTFTLQAGSTPGPVIVTASAPGLIDGQINAAVQSTVPLEPIQIISGDGQNAPIGTTLPEVLKVHVPAPLGTTAPDVTFTVTSGSALFADNNLAQITVPTDASGDAATALRFGNAIGDVVVTASAPGFLPVQFTLSALAPGEGYSLTRASTPPVGTTGFDSAPLIVSFTNAGTPVPGATVQWQRVSGDASLDTSTSITDNNGRAQTLVHFGLTAGTSVVRASVQPNGNSAPIDVDFLLTAANPSLIVVAGDGQSGPVGTVLDRPVEFQLRDGDGAALSGQTVQFSVTGPGTLTTPASASTDAAGKTQAVVRFGTTAGAVRVEASALGGRALASAQASAFVPALGILSGDQQSAMAGTALPQPLVVKLSGAAAAQMMAKGLGGLSVAWQVTCGNGSLATATTTTNASGESQNSLTLGTSPGCNTVQASIAGIGSVSFQATGTLPSNSVLEILSGNGQNLLPGVDSAPLRVRVRTATGEPVAGLVVRFASNRGGVQIAQGDVATAADGTAATTVRMGLPSTFSVTASVRDVATITPVEFTINVGIANTPGLTPPQQRIAEVIDTACPALAAVANPTPRQLDLLQRCSELVSNVGTRPGEVRDALRSLLANKGDAQNAAALAVAKNQLDNLKTRFSALRSGTRGFDLSGLNLMTGSGALPLSLLPSAIALAVGEPPEEVGADFSRWGFFATGTIGRGERDADSLDPGFDYSSYDITAGIDYRVTDSWILGGALGLNRNNTDLGDDSGGMDASGWTISGYASWFSNTAWYADAVLSYGRNSYDLDRRIRYGIAGQTVIDQLASASPDGDRQSLSLSVGRDFNRGAWTFGPYLRADYSKMDFDAYTETMSRPEGPGAGLALSVDARELKSLQGVVGGKLSYAMSTSWGVLVPNAQIEWVKEFEDDPDLLVTRFAFDPTQTPILIESDRIDSDYVNLGVGLSGVFANGRSAYVYYEHVAGQDRMSSDSLAIGVRIEF